MGIILHIDSDDVKGLGSAFLNAIKKHGILISNPIREFDYPEDDDDVPDIEPYFGIMPNMPRRNQIAAGNDDWLFQESGGVRYSSGGCGGGHCGGGGCRSFGCGAGHCGGGSRRSFGCGAGHC